jgi:hypothetical protein
MMSMKNEIAFCLTVPASGVVSVQAMLIIRLMDRRLTTLAKIIFIVIRLTLAKDRIERRQLSSCHRESQAA